MNPVDLAGLPPAPDGGPPVRIERRLLDQVPCAATVGPVRLLGDRLIVHCENPELALFLGAFLAHFEAAADAGTTLHVIEVGGRWAAYQDGGRALWAASVPAMARSLVWLLNAIALAAPAPDVHVHAAVASLGGRAVILPGRSGAGKTTLVAAMALDGWSYLSDEVAAFDVHHDLVHPYPRPLALEQGSWALVPDALGRWPDDVPELVTDLGLVLPATLGPAGPPVAARPVAIVFAEVIAGAVTALEPLTRAEAIERLVGLAFNLRSVGRDGFGALAGAVRRSSCHRLVLDGVAGAPGLLRALVGPPAERERSP